MAKKNNDWLIFGIVILVIIILPQLDWTKPYSYNTETTNQFAAKEKAGTSLGDNLGDPTNIQINLCEQAASEIESLCDLGGGTWICTKTEVGCYNLLISSCVISQIQDLLNKCKVAGAQAICKSSEIYCKY